MRDRQCALNHDATESAPMYLFFYLFIVSGVINKPTTVELCISPVYRRLAVAKLTPILIIGHPLPSSSIYNDPWHPLCSVYELDSPLRQPLARSSLVFLLPWTLSFILHAFLHPIIIFSQHMPIPTQPVLLLHQCYVIHT